MDVITRFHCDYGNHFVKHVRESNAGGTGYAVMKDGSKVCYLCAAEEDKKRMAQEGKYTLYLTTGADSKYVITNWPGTLKFPVRSMTTHTHNWGLNSYYVWFQGPDGYIWWGVTIGDNTQLCHCRRTQKKA